MSKMIQIRNVPEQIHRKLKARAAAAGTTLSEYLLDEMRRLAELPTIAELAERIARRGPVEPEPPAATLVRQGRDQR